MTDGEPSTENHEMPTAGRAAVPGAAVTLRSVSVVRGGRTVLTEVDIVLPAGLVIGVIGPSGCGKSTLMRSIVGVQEQVTGSIDVLGGPPGYAARRGEVGYVTQDPSVYGDLSVRENLQYFAGVLGVGADRVEDTIASVQLELVAHQRVDDLSGGQRARASLAISLLNGPPLLVLDEPTVGLDPVLRQELWSQFAALAADGHTLLVSSHVMDEADRCDWLVLLRAGRVLATGSPAELLTRTGADSVEDAFLTLVGERGGS